MKQIKNIDMRAYLKPRLFELTDYAIIVGLIFGFIFGVIFMQLQKPVNQIKPVQPIKKIITPTILPTLTPTKAPAKPLQSNIWRGYVSHYSRAGCLGCSETLTMANGEPLDDNRPTIAFNWLPMNTKVRITNTDNGKSMIVTVTDTGGFNSLNRVADLTPAVANYLETKTDQSLVIIEKL
jgi:hypothetical protein